MPKYRRVWKLISRNPKRYKRVWQLIPKPRPKYGINGTVGPAVRFTWSEVESGDGVQPTGDIKRRTVEQARLLNKLRKHIAKHYRMRFSDVSININSWYRSPSYNASIGGARFSQHPQGRATDITVDVGSRRLSPRKVAELAEGVPAFRNGGIGWYDEAHGNFTHVDHRPDGPSRWINQG